MWVYKGDFENSTQKGKSPFVSNEHDNHIGAGMLASIFKPCRQVVESIPPGQNKTQYMHHNMSLEHNKL